MGVDPFACDFPTLAIGGPIPLRRPAVPDPPATARFLAVIPAPRGSAAPATDTTDDPSGALTEDPPTDSFPAQTAALPVPRKPVDDAAPSARTDVPHPADRPDPAEPSTTRPSAPAHADAPVPACRDRATSPAVATARPSRGRRLVAFIGRTRSPGRDVGTPGPPPRG